MSRSFRKPYFGNANGSKQWKRESNKKIRKTHSNEDLPNGSTYKKINEVWISPMEMKHGYSDVNKFRRK